MSSKFSPYLVTRMKGEWNKPWTAKKFITSDSREELVFLHIYYYLQWHYSHVTPAARCENVLTAEFLDELFTNSLQIWQLFLNVLCFCGCRSFKVQGTAVATQNHVVRIPGQMTDSKLSVTHYGDNVPIAPQMHVLFSDFFLALQRIIEQLPWCELVHSLLAHLHPLNLMLL